MNFQRIDRISEEARRIIDQIIREDLKDPRISGTYSITRVDVTRDLSYAKVYVSVYEEDKRKDLIKALKGASGYIRRELGKRMVIRYSPELIFIEDNNIEYGVHIEDVLRRVNKSNENLESNDNE
ncbi:MAG: 30S ribosome-binding factor RbfA [Eubacteriales bacterium]|nr:30S ribosome-binding factor RbfA [Eubacteriales bacterium]